MRSFSTLDPDPKHTSSTLGDGRFRSPAEADPAMSHPPPSSPPGNPSRKQTPSVPPLNEDYSDFEDPTSINQIPSAQGQAIPLRPSAPLVPGGPAPGQFASASPSLSHIGSPAPHYAGSAGTA